MPTHAPPAKPAPGATLNAVVDDQQSLPGAKNIPALEAPKSGELLNSARTVARENPAAVASIVRGWVSGEAA